MSILSGTLARAVSAWLALTALLAVGGCSPARRAEPDLSVGVTGSDGGTLADVVFVLTSEDGSVRTAVCPDAPAPDTDCAATGLRVAREVRARQLTVKARRYAFASVVVDAEALPRVDGAAHLDVELDALAPFTVTDDYATGLEPDGAAAAFAALAVPMTTDLGPAEVVKFFIADLGNEPRVFLQNTRRHPLHYDFARDVLGAAQSLPSSRPRPTTERIAPATRARSRTTPSSLLRARPRAVL